MVMGAKGTSPIKKITTRISRNINTIYQAPSDGFVSFNTQMGNQGEVFLYSDAATPPTVEIAHVHTDAGNAHLPCCKPIKKNDYWKITYAGAGTIDLVFWIPLEP